MMQKIHRLDSDGDELLLEDYGDAPLDIADTIVYLHLKTSDGKNARIALSMCCLKDLIETLEEYYNEGYACLSDANKAALETCL